MASTIQLQRLVNLGQIQIRQAPLVGVGQIPNEPAFTIGDWVRQTILSPPFAWRWNRATTTINTVVLTQDYTVSLPNFGWIEKANLIDQQGNVIPELEIVLNLGQESMANQPTRICARLDDDAGNITFRLTPPPDKIYTLNIDYQMSAPSFANLTDTFAPIPDYMYNVVQQGFFAKTYEYMSDERFAFSEQMFMRQLVAMNDGLSESQKNIFMIDRLNTARESQSVLGTNQSARAGRAG